jgi:hypothetical protein
MGKAANLNHFWTLKSKENYKENALFKKSGECGHGFLLKFDVKNDLRYLNRLK